MWRAFDLKQEVHLWLTLDRSLVNWKEFVSCPVRASEIYSEAKSEFSVTNRDILLNAQYPHMWWSTPKSDGFGSISSVHLLVGGGGGLVRQLVSGADLFAVRSF